MIAPPSARPCRQRDDAPERSMAVPEPKPASPKRRFLRVQVMPAGLIQYASCRCYLNCVMRRAAAQIIPKCPRECWRDDARSREFAVHWVPVSGCCRGIYAEDGSDDKGAHCVEEEAEDRRIGRGWPGPDGVRNFGPCRISRAAFAPEPPVRPVPGWVPEPQR